MQILLNLQEGSMKHKILVVVLIFSLLIDGYSKQFERRPKNADGKTITSGSNPDNYGKENLTQDEIEKFSNFVAEGKYEYIKYLAGHYKKCHDEENMLKWLKIGAEHDDVWSICELCTYKWTQVEVTQTEIEKYKARLRTLNAVIPFPYNCELDPSWLEE